MSLLSFPHIHTQKDTHELTRTHTHTHRYAHAQKESETETETETEAHRQTYTPHKLIQNKHIYTQAQAHPQT